MSHQEFVNFDLLNKKHITVEELIKPDVEKQLVDALLMQILIGFKSTILAVKTAIK